MKFIGFQMSLYESDSLLFIQKKISQLHIAPANLGKRSVRKISRYNNHREHHISDISSKATKTLSFLRRNLAFA